MTGFDSKRRMAADKLQEPEREALKLALEALDDMHIVDFPLEDLRNWNKAITAIKAALAQPAQEPVAWAVQGCSKMWRGEFAEIDAKAEAKRIGGTCVAYALYTAPPQRPWIWLSDADIRETIDSICQYNGDYDEFLCKKIERKIKELNT
jgi:hypothetical protein